MISYIADEGQGHGRGYYVHKGRGVGHDKKAEKAMADGQYTLITDDISHTNHGTTDQTLPQGTLADGTSLYTEVRAGSIAIGAAPDHDGDSEALHLQTDSNNGRLRVGVVYDEDNQFHLGDLTALSFDYYIASSDRTDVVPVIRLAIDADGNLATTNDRGELVFEYAYQGQGPTTQGSWQHVDLAGDDWNAWQRSNGANHDFGDGFATLSNWSDADGYTPTGGIHFDANSVVLGYSIAYGSGNGTGDMYVDNLQVGGVTYAYGTDSFF